MPIKNGFSLVTELMNDALLMNKAAKVNKHSTRLMIVKTADSINYTNSHIHTDSSVFIDTVPLSTFLTIVYFLEKTLDIF